MVETNMSEKTLSIEMNKLKQARYSIGIAMSEEKYSGIVGALRGKYINCLVTNSSTAELLLGNDSNLLIVFYVQIMPDDFVMQLHRF